MKNKNKEYICEYVSGLARDSLSLEVSLSPKPGLVDSVNNGSHDDMTLETFNQSIRALSPFFNAYIMAGITHKGTPKDLFKTVRQIGVDAEIKMLLATNHINTHKGANFSFAVILGAIGYHLKESGGTVVNKVDSDAILEYIKKMCRGLASDDFKHIHKKAHLTNGEKLFLNSGILGIRGEAESGYVSLTQHLLPFFRENARNMEPDELYLRGLILLMATVEDSNIYHRGGKESVEYVQRRAQEIHQKQLPKLEFIQCLREYDTTLIEKHLSPGGCADLLSLGIFFYLLEDMSADSGMKL
ncbi:MAG: triphosphoribosyl-dephospho-CoA synthase CitG [Vagococcus sp.]